VPVSGAIPAAGAAGAGAAAVGPLLVFDFAPASMAVFNGTGHFGTFPCSTVIRAVTSLAPTFSIMIVKEGEREREREREKGGGLIWRKVLVHVVATRTMKSVNYTQSNACRCCFRCMQPKSSHVA
jgi:hypothetical protein